MKTKGRADISSGMKMDGTRSKLTNKIVDGPHGTREVSGSNIQLVDRCHYESPPDLLWHCTTVLHLRVILESVNPRLIQD